MHRRRTLVALLLVLLLAGCARSPQAPSQAPARAPAGPEHAPVAVQPAPQPAAPPDPAPPPVRPAQEPVLTVWAVDLTEKVEPEVLYQRQGPFELLAVSPDGRHWLLEKVTDYFGGGILYLLDRQSGELRESPLGEVWPREARWSGRGFWVDWLVHLDLNGQVDRYPALREAAGLNDRELTLLRASFSADGRRVALAMMDRRVDPLKQASVDLVIANADGSGLVRVPRVAQPMAIFGKTGGFVLLDMAPNGEHLVLLSRSPGLALISTATPQREHWHPLLQPFVPVQTDDEGGPPGRTSWAPDGKHVWVPVPGQILAPDGQLVAATTGWLGGLWTPDGRGVVTLAVGEGVHLTTLDGAERPFTTPEGSRPVGFLPDGRLLVTRSVPALP